MVPALVPPERLMNGVALQMMSMNVAMMLGAVVGGAAIALLGNAGGLGLLALCAAGAALSMARVQVAARVPVERTTKLGAEMVEGLRWSLGREPVRSLLGIMLVIGFLWGGVQLLLPDLAKTELGCRRVRRLRALRSARPRDDHDLAPARQPIIHRPPGPAARPRRDPQPRPAGRADRPLARAMR